MIKLISVSLFVILQFSTENAFEITPRIVNGYSAFPAQFPFFAFLAINNRDGSSSGCGATLLNDEWLITAAHCTIDASWLDVNLGTSQLDSIYDPGHYVIRVEEDNFFEYPRYFQPLVWNDISRFYKI